MNMIIKDNLFSEILTNPMRDGLNELCIVSGYATAAMAFRHLQYASEHHYPFSLRLLVGMCPNDGISDSNHSGFKQLVENDFKNNFECSYTIKLPAVHSKVYAWLRDGQPVHGFSGSANYTQSGFGFGQKRREVMSPCDAVSAHDYYQKLIRDSIYCSHNDVDALISIYQEHQKQQQTSLSFSLPPHLVGLDNVRVSLLTARDQMPHRSGLNWGQRPEEGRNPNQAYIALRASVYNTDFFPERGVHFSVLTDNGKTIICSRAQDNAKGIHTPHNNALIGEYFRNRIGLPSGAEVKKSDLESYGRTDVTFYKIDDETYYMDFSV